MKKRVSFGIINGIEDNRVRHLCNTDKGSGGSPIMILSNGKIIGMNVGSSIKFNFNMGTFLKYPIKEFVEKWKLYSF